MSEAGAVLFDIDGTLVDSNYHHVVAWQRAFRDVNAHVEGQRIHARIGEGGSLLVDELLDHPSDAVAERATTLHSQYFAGFGDELELVPGARELIRAVADSGLRVVLASSAGPKEFSTLNELLDIDEHVYASTTGDDVDQEKPDPSLVQVALDRAGVPAERAVMVGDAVWDAKSAGRAGVSTIGFLSGGIARERLLEAGAIAVYANAAELLDNLASSPIAKLW